jgi:hypothetical protein
MFYKGALAMSTNSENHLLIKQPSAWLPLVMSLAALVFLLSYVATFGIHSSDGDEGTPARIFQLIMAAQLPIAGYFSVRWLPKQTKQAMMILVLQAAAWIIPILAVMWFESM